MSAFCFFLQYDGILHSSCLFEFHLFDQVLGLSKDSQCVCEYDGKEYAIVKMNFEDTY